MNGANNPNRRVSAMTSSVHRLANVDPSSGGQKPNIGVAIDGEIRPSLTSDLLRRTQLPAGVLMSACTRAWVHKCAAGTRTFIRHRHDELERFIIVQACTHNRDWFKGRVNFAAGDRTDIDVVQGQVFAAKRSR